MNQDISSISSKLKNSLPPEQFDQVVEAILAGKYSWACVLMLRFAGYNPLHYIPYRTYNRLLKENSLMNRAQKQQNSSMNQDLESSDKRSDTNVSPSCLSKITDLAYREVNKQKAEIRKPQEQWLAKQVQ
ncbi:heterocyst differentiation protein [Calothrix sp. NIES-2100]|uniref:HetP family heterocyst commitment protein n=1 Tax=Calothrix sp. NIES-2100 TaxID=1954172 RepID=UPI000B60A66A|nr:heterocyst differentiation protein [Calothrix sp. NIES-2100]